MNKILQSILQLNQEEYGISHSLETALNSLADGEVIDVTRIPINGAGEVVFDIVPAAQSTLSNVEGTVIRFYNSAGEVAAEVPSLEWNGHVPQEADTLRGDLSRDISIIASDVTASINFHDCISDISSQFSCQAKVKKSDVISIVDGYIMQSPNADLSIVRRSLSSLPKDELIATDFLGLMKQVYGSSKNALEGSDDDAPYLPDTGFLVTTGVITTVVSLVLKVLAAILMVVSRILAIIVYLVSNIIDWISQNIPTTESVWNPDCFNDLYNYPIDSKVVTGDSLSNDLLTELFYDSDTVVLENICGCHTYLMHDLTADGEHRVASATYLGARLDPSKVWGRLLSDTKYGHITEDYQYLIRILTPPQSIEKNAEAVMIFDNRLTAMDVLCDWWDTNDYDLSDDDLYSYSSSHSGRMKLLKTSLFAYALANIYFDNRTNSNFAFAYISDPSLDTIKPSQIDNFAQCIRYLCALTVRARGELLDFEGWLDKLSDDDALTLLDKMGKYSSLEGSSLFSFGSLVSSGADRCVSVVRLVEASYGSAYEYLSSSVYCRPNSFAANMHPFGFNYLNAYDVMATQFQESTLPVVGFPLNFSYELPVVTKGFVWAVGIFTSLAVGLAIGASYFGRRSYVRRKTKKMVNRSIATEKALAEYKENPTDENYKAYYKAARKYNRIAGSLGYSTVGIMGKKVPGAPSSESMTSASGAMAGLLGTSSETPELTMLVNLENAITGVDEENYNE